MQSKIKSSSSNHYNRQLIICTRSAWPITTWTPQMSLWLKMVVPFSSTLIQLERLERNCQPVVAPKAGSIARWKIIRLQTQKNDMFALNKFRSWLSNPTFEDWIAVLSILDSMTGNFTWLDNKVQILWEYSAYIVSLIFDEEISRNIYGEESIPKCKHPYLGELCRGSRTTAMNSWTKRHCGPSSRSNQTRPS